MNRSYSNCPKNPRCGSVIIEFDVFYDMDTGLTIDEIKDTIRGEFENANLDLTPVSKYIPLQLVNSYNSPFYPNEVNAAIYFKLLFKICRPVDQY